MTDPEKGEVSRRTAFVRNNGDLDGVPSFTIISNRCVHLGCPVQPNGPVEDEDAKEIETVRLIPTEPTGFGCPCHGGQYDIEGNRTAGPPVRALDRYEFKIEGDRLVLVDAYSVGMVEGQGARRGSRSTPRGARRARRRGRGLALPDPGAELMAPARSRRQQIEGAVIYPLDWIEERSGLIGGLDYFLFRRVPRDISWAHTLGSASLTAFLVQTITGVILAMYYHPHPDTAYESIRRITNDITLGWLVRGMHRWGASVFIILMFFHMARVFLFGAYRYPRELNWIIGVLLLVMGMLEGFTGYLLPWDQTVYWATVVGINLNGTGPFVGPFLAQFLRGGSEIGADTLTRFYSLHMLVLPGGLFALIGLHLWLVIRLGVTPQPWAHEASEPEPEPVPTGRPGLVRPGARGTGR